MAETKTRPTEVSAETFLAAVEPAAKREDGHVLDALFRQVTGEPGVMWGPSIVGYGRYRYTYESGHSGEMCRAGFSSRKAKHSIYLLGCRTEDPEMEGLLAKLGKHSRGVGCLYVNKLADIDLAVLEQMIALAWKRSFDSWPE